MHLPNVLLAKALSPPRDPWLQTLIWDSVKAKTTLKSFCPSEVHQHTTMLNEGYR